MGLDMYLDAKRYIGGHHDHRDVSGVIHITERGGEKELLNLVSMEAVSEIVFRAVYWRKANAIHRYFVERTQDGVDECQESYVSREQLEDLISLCEKTLEIVKASPKKTVPVLSGFISGKDIYTDVEAFDVDEELLENLLPTCKGFFFGSTLYDEWYVRSLEETIEDVGEALKNPLFKDCSFHYRASW